MVVLRTVGRIKGSLGDIGIVKCFQNFTRTKILVSDHVLSVRDAVV